MTHYKTIEAYDQFADAYDQGVVAFWAQFPQDFLESFAAQLPGKRVLSLGSGSGRDALLLRQMGMEVVCVDASPSMVAMTRSLGFESHVATFAEMTFDASSFDGVWAHGSLMHISTDEAVSTLRRLQTFLTPDGLLALGVIKGVGERLYKHRSMPGHIRYNRLYQNTELRQIVTPLGFEFLCQKDYVLPYDTFLNHMYRVCRPS